MTGSPWSSRCATEAPPMFPISDDNPTLRTPVVTYLTLGAIALVWFFFQGAGFNTVALAASVCNWGMVPGELTGLAPLGFRVPLGEGMWCVVENQTLNLLTPLTSMFLHGGWGHIIGNCLFLWVFGNNVEDSMGRVRFVIFYVLCGLVAAGAHVLIDPSSPVPTVGASGAISGVLGAYLVLYPRVRVKLLVPIFIILTFISLPAWVVLHLLVRAPGHHRAARSSRRCGPTSPEAWRCGPTSAASWRAWCSSSCSRTGATRPSGPPGDTGCTRTIPEGKPSLPARR